MTNLVEQVSIKEPVVYSPIVPAICGNDSKPIVVIAIDVGMKNNQIRCFLKRGVTLKVVPWDYNFLDEEFDGLFISNGPGDPTVLQITIQRIKEQLEKKNKPIFGICLGHQLIALAAGGQTEKLLFGNRGFLLNLL